MLMIMNVHPKRLSDIGYVTTALIKTGMISAGYY